MSKTLQRADDDGTRETHTHACLHDVRYTKDNLHLIQRNNSVSSWRWKLPACISLRWANSACWLRLAVRIVPYTSMPVAFWLSGELVSQFVGALSPVNHKGLHQGWTPTSLSLHVYSFHMSLYHKSCFFKPSYIPRVLNTGTCLWQGDLFYSAGLHRNHVLDTANTRKIGRGFGKMGRKGRNKQGRNPRSKRSMYGYILTCSRL